VVAAEVFPTRIVSFQQISHLSTMNTNRNSDHSAWLYVSSSTGSSTTALREPHQT
jgi:hypothetical protein